jgi:hypothetical protein
MALQEQLRSKMATYDRLRKEELSQCDGLFTNAIIQLTKGTWVADAAEMGQSYRVIKAKYLNIPSYCLTTAVITKPQKPIEGVKVMAESSLLKNEQDGEIPIKLSW